jgi:hypothetical protein
MKNSNNCVPTAVTIFALIKQGGNAISLSQPCSNCRGFAIDIFQDKCLMFMCGGIMIDFLLVPRSIFKA